MVDRQTKNSSVVRSVTSHESREAGARQEPRQRCSTWKSWCEEYYQCGTAKNQEIKIRNPNTQIQESIITLFLL